MFGGAKIPAGAADKEREMVRSLNASLADAFNATATAEKERDQLKQDRALMASSLAAEKDKAASLQALLAHERSAVAAKLEAAVEAALSSAAEKEATAVSRVAELEEELDAAREEAHKLDEELWRNAEKQVAASSRLGVLQQEARDRSDASVKAQEGSGEGRGGRSKGK